jgi:hypothetical protein
MTSAGRKPHQAAQISSFERRFRQLGQLAAQLGTWSFLIHDVVTPIVSVFGSGIQSQSAVRPVAQLPRVIQAYQIFIETEKTHEKRTSIFLLPGR